MLVLTRKVAEKVVIDLIGHHLFVVEVLAIESSGVKLGLSEADYVADLKSAVEAPKWRMEVSLGLFQETSVKMADTRTFVVRLTDLRSDRARLGFTERNAAEEDVDETDIMRFELFVQNLSEAVDAHQ